MLYAGYAGYDSPTQDATEMPLRPSLVFVGSALLGEWDASSSNSGAKNMKWCDSDGFYLVLCGSLLFFSFLETELIASSRMLNRSFAATRQAIMKDPSKARWSSHIKSLKFGES